MTEGADQGAGDSDFAYLQQELQGDRDAVQEHETGEMDVRQQAQDGEGVDGGSEGRKQAHRGKTIRFQKGDEIWEIPEDAIAEIKADKKLQQLKAFEMRDKAAGDIAVQNRMRDLAEKRKETETFVKNFNKFSKDDPLKALEYAVDYASRENPELKFDGFLNALAEQATRLSEMTEAERKSYKLERDLQEKEEKMQSYEVERNFNRLKTQYLEENDISSNEFDRYAQAVLEDPELVKAIGKEEDLIDAVRGLHYEVEAQRASYHSLKKFVPDLTEGDKQDERIILDFASILKDNPDFTKEDVEEVLYRAVRGNRKRHASQSLSRKQRKSVSSKKHEEDSLSDYEYLKKALLQDRKQPA